MDIEARLEAIEKNQLEILKLLTKGAATPLSATMSLKQAAAYTGFSPDHFRRLAVEQRIIPFVRPSGQQKGKILFRKSDLDAFLDESKAESRRDSQPGRKRKSKEVRLW